MSLFSDRSGLRILVSVLLLVCLLDSQCEAMLYRPSVGRFKDGFILWSKGQFYLFSMHTPGEEENFRNVWLATSSDGVHWKHVGPVIKDAPFNIWAMSVHQVGDKFIMNHGSFSRPGVGNVIRFWESTDLVHWTFLGHEADLFPDPRWYHPESRLDCMSVVPVAANGKTKYYGFATGPGGFLESADGIRWSGLPRPHMDWDTVPPPPTPPDEGGFEVGGCHAIDGRYYLVGGWFNYMGATGYGVYTLVADTPVGPFRADAAAYRLCGNSTRWVALWARFCPTDTDVLVNGYMYSGYTYETGETWLPPLKKAIVDPNGHLRLGYWKGNEAIKGVPTTIDLSTCSKVYPNAAQGECSCNAVANRLDIQAQPERNSIQRTNIPTAVAILENSLDFQKGVVIEGTMQATCRDRRLVASSVGFYLEEQPGEGTAILLHSYGRTEIGKMTLTDRVNFQSEDTIGPGCAAPAGILPHTNHAFRLMIRKNMFELYVDDMLVQTFNTTHEPGTIGRTPQRIGFIAENGQGVFENVTAWSMNLDE
ncbi:MAG: glycoside hydrolase family protein [Pirellulaceae bacterium]